MVFITTKDYLAEHPTEMLGGDGAIDPIQPIVEFACGLQLEITRNKDLFDDGQRRKKVGVAGAGDAFTKFALPTFSQRGTELYIADPKRVNEAIMEYQATGCPAYAVSSIQDMPNDLDYILILTPPASHKDLVKEAVAKGVPVAIEKPLASSKQDVEELDRFLQTTKAPVYCIDWGVMQALPLLNALGINVPFTDTLETMHSERFKEFDFGNIIKVDARFVEGGTNSLGDLDKLIANRPWMMDYHQGGGVLYDMAVHPLNVLAVMGLKKTNLKKVFLGTPTAQKGVYYRFGKEHGNKEIGEIYARVNFTMGIDGGNQSIEAIIEVGKHAKESDGWIELTDRHGHMLRWEMFPTNAAGQRIPGSKLEMFGSLGKVVATSILKADCYSLLMEDICRFVKSGEKATPYFPEHRDMIYAITDMHALARSQDVADGETVTQLKMMESQFNNRRLYSDLA